MTDPEIMDLIDQMFVKHPPATLPYFNSTSDRFFSESLSDIVAVEQMCWESGFSFT